MTKAELINIKETTEIIVDNHLWEVYKYFFKIKKIESKKNKDGFSYYGVVTEHFLDGAKVGQFNIDEITEEKIYLFTCFLGSISRVEVDIKTLIIKK